MDYKRNFTYKMLSIAFGITLAACSGSTIDPDTDPVNPNPSTIVMDKISVPSQFLKITGENKAELTNLGTTNSFTIYLSLDQADTGVDANVTYTGQGLADVSKVGKRQSGGFEFELKSADSKYTISRSDKKPILKTTDEKTAYTTFESNKLIWQSISVTNTESQIKAEQLLDKWTTKLNEAKVKVTGVTGIEGEGTVTLNSNIMKLIK
ncbi:hypothetical protein [Emticicia fontis]